ncbi:MULTISPECIES: hypothetical protein [unclassified Mesorhizobium]|uniref:hypothetical protein n=1 Tax=unclassified Mesorhizobium TaxID=325217 RepID=UPI000FCBCC16|nr:MULTISPECIES: hypothetical protein [unclassified Mesorhizobium]RUX97446.1 hypothetical protein EN993_03855 [Mesorhizobium sp. M7D.F.Ca.US.004.01.2.1]RVA36632.1 hypothetical protein EN935_01665 [Mesorhizobium sp. M7D.F.Ca.US.004.03.1.1]
MNLTPDNLRTITHEIVKDQPNVDSHKLMASMVRTVIRLNGWNASEAYQWLGFVAHNYREAIEKECGA